MNNETNEHDNETNGDEPAGEAQGTDAPVIDELRSENQKLKEIVRLRDAREQITGALAKEGARSPGLLFAFAAGDLQFGEDGKLENQAAIVDKLRRSFPEQFAADAPLAQIDGGAGAHQQRPYLSKEALSRMKPAEIAKLDWAEVKQVLSER